MPKIEEMFGTRGPAGQWKESSSVTAAPNLMAKKCQQPGGGKIESGDWAGARGW